MSVKRIYDYARRVRHAACFTRRFEPRRGDAE